MSPSIKVIMIKTMNYFFNVFFFILNMKTSESNVLKLFGKKVINNA